MHKINPANNSDYPAIEICFNEPAISYLFAELVEAQGFSAIILEDITKASKETSIITEPFLFDRLPDLNPKRCMIVCENGAPGMKDAVQLVRPLSEEKIERAFSAFLPERNASE